MKKAFLTLLVLSAFGIAHAQKFKFGPKAGLNISMLSGDVPNDLEFQIGAQIGGVAEIKFTDKIALQPELLVSLQGAKYDYRFDYFGGYEDHQDNLDLIYINVPVMARYYFVKGFNVEVGPQLGVLVSAKSRNETTYAEDGVVTTESHSTDVKEGYNTIDLGANFGLGYDFSNGIFVGARYTLGLLNIADTTGPGSVKNSVISISGGFKF